MGRNVVRRTYVSSAGRLLEPGLCSQSSHLLPLGAKRSRLASVDTVKGFVFFTATEGRMCLSSWETPFVTILYILAITHTWSLTETGAHIICSIRLKIKKKIEKSFMVVCDERVWVARWYLTNSPQVQVHNCLTRMALNRVHTSAKAQQSPFVLSHSQRPPTYTWFFSSRPVTNLWRN